MNYDLLIDLHKHHPRQGPGDSASTLLALQLSGLIHHPHPLQVADLGCGTGASTLILAQHLNAQITAVDLFSDFLDQLNANAHSQGLHLSITPTIGDMKCLPFKQNSLDLIWAEGSIYNMGFTHGVEYLKSFLKPEGILAVSEITWLTAQRPEPIQTYWDEHYPEIATASEKIQILEKQGFTLKGYFPLATSTWLDHYYHPLEQGFTDFLTRHHHSTDAQAIVDQERKEIAFYKQYAPYYSYGFYIAQKN